MAQKISDTFARAIESPAKGSRIYYDTKVPGFGLRVTARGVKSFVLNYRNRAGVERRYTIGRYGREAHQWSVEAARRKAGQLKKEIRDGYDPLGEREAEREAEAEEAVAAERTVGKVVDRFLEKHAKTLRGYDEVERVFNMYVLPRWRDRAIDSIRRSEVNALLDDVAAGKVKGQRGGGAVMADHVLAWLSKAFAWYQIQDDDFISPIVRGMRRTKAKELARHRVLSDAELRALWAATEGSVYGSLVRTVLLTGQRPGTGGRQGEVVAMRRSEITDGVWSIPAERSKTGLPLHVPLSEMVKAVIDSVPRVNLKDGAGSDLIFTFDGERPMSGFSRKKGDLDHKMAKALAEAGESFAGWRLHDLRRSARSLMSRAGVPSRHAELVLGHVIPGIEGVYDRHSYAREKAEAVEALAALIQRILAGQDSEVVPLRRVTL